MSYSKRNQNDFFDRENSAEERNCVKVNYCVVVLQEFQRSRRLLMRKLHFKDVVD